MEITDSSGSITLATCSIDMLFFPEETERAVELLRTTIGITQAKSGCRSAAISRDAAEENRIRYTEEWDSQQAFERHLASDEFGRVLLAMDMCCREPQVIIGSLSGRTGIASLQELREKRDHDGE